VLMPAQPDQAAGARLRDSVASHGDERPADLRSSVERVPSTVADPAAQVSNKEGLTDSLFGLKTFRSDPSLRQHRPGASEPVASGGPFD